MLIDEAATGQILPGRSRPAPGATFMEDTGDQPEPTKKDRLDSYELRELHKRLLSFFTRELDRQSANRRDMERDEAFYDHDQWSSEDKETLERRGQVAIVYNFIFTTINWLLGTEIRTRSDAKVLPRRKEGSKGAERKTQLLKYLSDTSGTVFHHSDAFAECVKAGIGWLECGLQDGEGEPIYDRHESWRNILWDSACVEHRNMADARYIFRMKWMDEDAAIDMFPERRSIIRRAAEQPFDAHGSGHIYGDEAMDSREEPELEGVLQGADVYQAPRRRVRMIEAWYRQAAEIDRMKGGEFAGDKFDPWNDAHIEQISAGKAQVGTTRGMQMNVAIMTTAGMLYQDASPYAHNKFPFTPIWCYRRAKDGLPYGVIRGLRDAQADINKRASKALHIISTNKILMEEGAVADVEDLREEAANPDAIIVYRAGKKLDLNVDRELAPAHLDLMSRSIAMIQAQSGVTDENMGRDTNATSGKAILAKQQQGALATAGLFDNLLHARTQTGQKKLSLIEQFMGEEKEFRITNSRGAPEYVIVNDKLPENDITRTKADYIISEQEWNHTLRQAMTQELLELLAQVGPVAPGLVLAVLDLLVESMDIPSRDEIVKRIRQMTGNKDPDAEPDEPPTPEEQAKADAQAEEAALQKRAIEAKIGKDEAQAREASARADRAGVEAAKIAAALSGLGLDDQQKALQLAAGLLAMPRAAAVADSILADAQRGAPSTGGAQPMTGPTPEPAPMPPPDQPPGPEMAPPPMPVPFDQPPQM
jgi:hypothetical protein